MQKIVNVKNDCRGMFNEEIIDTIFENRGIKNRENFMNPTLEEHMLPLDDLKNINKAVDIVLGGLKRGDLFGVYADV